MKKLLLIAIALIGLQVTAQGERKGKDHENMSAEDIATKRTEKMVEQLGLDKTQEKAVYALNLDVAEKRKEMMDARKNGEKAERPSEEEREKMRAERKTQREAYQAKLKEILTDEQFAKLEESAKKGRRGDRKKKES